MLLSEGTDYLRLHMPFWVIVDRAKPRKKKKGITFWSESSHWTYLIAALITVLILDSVLRLKDPEGRLTSTEFYLYFTLGIH